MADDFDDFTFDDDDFADFGDEFDDDFGDDLGDDLSAELGGDDDDTFTFDDDFDLDDIGALDEAGFDDFEEGDLPDLVEQDDDGGGGNRTFVILAGLMILVFIGGIAVVVVLALGGDDVDPSLDMTRTAIAEINATTLAQAAETATQSLIIAQNMTETAMAPTATPIPPTRTPTFTPTLPPTLDQTQIAGTDQAQPTKEPPTPTPDDGITEIDANAVAQTATALAEILVNGDGSPPPDIGGGEIATPTRDSGSTGPLPTALPATGFFDDVGTSSASMMSIVLLGFGLLGVIVVSRRLRSGINKS